jgi:hypothetical protein
LPLHSSVQVNPNLKHLHLPRHSDLQPHLANCSQLCATGAFAVQNNPHYSPIFFQPQSAGLSATGWHWVAWPHMQPAWYAARLVRWSRAALVGGTASYGLCFRANMPSLASSTLTAVLHRSHSRTTNCSRISRSLSVRTGGYWLSLLKMKGLRENVPGLPGSLFAFVAKGWYSITTCKGVKELNAFGLNWPNNMV